jgi:endonuclease YncB( thermonuclease family)
MRVGALLLGLLIAGSAWADTLSGRATVLDGDTIEITGERIRLHGIDAPESGQQCRDADGAPWPCGQKASFALDDFLAASRPTHCTMVDRDRWGRVVATCIRNDGADVNEWLVRQGWALDWPRYSDGAYHGAQREARISRRGIWRGEFVEPWAWRAGARLNWTVGGEPLDPDCVIKGNINGRGERIYHVPGGQFYDQAIIDETAGQRWFCSEKEALDAGWRPSRR